MKRKILTLILVSALILSMVSTAYAVNPFEKVRTWWEEIFNEVTSVVSSLTKIKDACEQVLTSGNLDVFEENATLAEVVAVAARIHSIAVKSEEAFVETKVWYQTYVDYALRNGILTNDLGDYTRIANPLEIMQIMVKALLAEVFPQNDDAHSGQNPDFEDDRGECPPVSEPETTPDPEPTPDIEPEPEQPGTEPEQPGTEPEEPGTEPEQPGTEPEEPGTEPEQPGTEPEEPGTEPEQPGTEPEQPGTEPEQPGTEPEQPGTEPEEPGTEPEQPGTEPEQPGTEPEQPGTEPEQPGTEPEQPGTEPEQPGTEPEQPGTEPEQPGTEPEQPGTEPEQGPAPSVDADGYINIVVKL